MESSRSVRCRWSTAAWYRFFFRSVLINIILQTISKWILDVVSLIQLQIHSSLCVIILRMINIRTGSTVAPCAWNTWLIWSSIWCRERRAKRLNLPQSTVHYILKQIIIEMFCYLLYPLFICISLSCILQNHQNQHSNGSMNDLRKLDAVFQKQAHTLERKLFQASVFSAMSSLVKPVESLHVIAASQKSVWLYKGLPFLLG